MNFGKRGSIKLLIGCWLFAGGLEPWVRFSMIPGFLIAQALHIDPSPVTPLPSPATVDSISLLTGSTTSTTLPRTRNAGELYAVDGIVGNLRYVPAGNFLQGTDPQEPGHDWDEEPQFQHTLTKNLAVMETAVSRQMWADLRSIQSTLPPDPTNDFYGSEMTNPVQSISWNQAILYANLLSRQQGLQPTYYADGIFLTPIDAGNYQGASVYADWDANGYRLPTEGEREYFTRASTTGPFWMMEPAYNLSIFLPCAPGALGALEGAAWFCANAQGQTQAVGNKAANPWGLKDVHGNVWEWCWDWYDFYPEVQQTDYRGPSSGSSRVIRGGGWAYTPRELRSGARSSYNPLYNGFSTCFLNLGFRLLKIVP